jgi:hypothetical protein
MRDQPGQRPPDWPNPHTKSGMSKRLLCRQQNAARKPLRGIAGGDPLSVNRSGDD